MTLLWVFLFVAGKFESWVMRQKPNSKVEKFWQKKLSKLFQKLSVEKLHLLIDFHNFSFLLIQQL